MDYLLIPALLVLCVYSVTQTPHAWWKKPASCVPLVLFHVCGVMSVILLLTTVRSMQDGFLRDAVIYTDTLYLGFSMFFIYIGMMRQLLHYIFRHTRCIKITRFTADKRIACALALVVSVAYLVPAIINGTNLTLTKYEISTPKTCKTDHLRVALVSDIHAGAGASPQILDRMAEIINGTDPDIVVLNGDIIDSSTSASDMSHLGECLKKIHSRYGVFYVDGNHDNESPFDIDACLNSAGIRILRDEAVELPCGVNLVGRRDPPDVPIPDILQKAGLNSDSPCIALQHRPTDSNAISKDCDLLLCGHTHGISHPIMPMTADMLHEYLYGLRTFGGMHTVITSGVSLWGFRMTWPSQNEVVQVDWLFGKEAE